MTRGEQKWLRQSRGCSETNWSQWWVWFKPFGVHLLVPKPIELNNYSKAEACRDQPTSAGIDSFHFISFLFFLLHLSLPSLVVFFCFLFLFFCCLFLFLFSAFRSIMCFHQLYLVLQFFLSPFLPFALPPLGPHPFLSLPVFNEELPFITNHSLIFLVPENTYESMSL